MTKPAQNPSVKIAFNSEHIDSASLHLAGANGLLYLIQTTLEPNAGELTSSEAVGIMATVQSLIDWTYTDLEKDSHINGHDWTDVLVWLNGITGALSVLHGGHNGLYDLPNNRIQQATLHSLQTVIGEAIDYIESIWAVTTKGGVSA